MSQNFQLLSLMAIGDAYGMKYEFVEHEPNINRSDLFYGPHPKFEDYKAGHYTDDTQMSLANAELLIAAVQKGFEVSEDQFIEAWLSAFKRDPRLGYSRHMYQTLSEVSSPAEFRARLDPSKGTTSGAAMRAAPFGLLADIEDIKLITAAQARLTHNTSAGINSALAVALSIYYLRHEGSKENLPEWLSNQIGPNFQDEGYSDSPSNGIKIVRHALKAVLKAETLSEVLINVVNLERVSDTDTVAAIAMAMASQCSAISNDLPKSLEEGLENGPCGRDYLISVDRKIAENLLDGREAGNGKKLIKTLRHG